MSPLRSTLHHARAASAVSGARPAYAAGLRAAIASVAPLVLGHLLHSTGGVWMSIAGLNGAFADNGGPYRTRATTMSILAVASAVAIAIGTLVAGHLALAVAVTFVLGALCSLARVWGDAGSVVGVTALLVFVIGLAIPPGAHAQPAHEAIVRAGFVLAGGAWAMLVALVLWPIRPWHPLRLAVAACWDALAGYTDDVARRASEGQSRDGWALRDSVVAMRTALERARGALALARRGRPAQSGRGEQLLVLHEMADQAFVHVIALADAVETVPRAERDPRAEAVLGETLDRVAAGARGVANAITAPRAAPVTAAGCDGRALRLQLTDRGAGVPLPESAAAQYAHAAALLDRVAEYLAAAGAVARGLEGEHAVVLPEELLTAEEPPRPHWRETAVQAVTAADSLVLRHALRVALVTAVAVWLTGALHLARGYWVTITVVIILQPYAGATTQKALQRVGGTVLGGIIAAALSAALHDPVAIMALVFVFTALCVAVLPLNYGMYAVLGTPAFVLLAEVNAADWHLSGLRILNTLIGGALALAGSAVLRAGPEERRFSDYAAAALRADGAYLLRAIALAAGAAERAVGTLRDARRAVSLAASNAEDSFQRLLGEHRGPPEALEPVMALLTYVRRLGASIGALALTYEEPSPPMRETLDRLAREAGAILDDLAEAVETSRAPAPLPPIGSDALGESQGSPVLRARVRRITRQLRSLHDAVEHWAEARQRGGEGQVTSPPGARSAA